jgi:predicted nucleic acid-binding protein
MICLDTAFLIHLWRNRQDPSHPTTQLLAQNPTEVFAVPVAAAGEFLEGAAFISASRFAEALRFLALFEVGLASLETARRYAQIVADLRRRKLLAGASKADLWIAAWAVEHQAALATQNAKHFRHVEGLRLIPY